MATQMPVKPVSRPFGLWDSPIQPVLLGQRLRFADVQWSRDGQDLIWVEGRSGVNTLVAQASGTAFRDLTSGQNVSGGVGYGGGEFSTGRENIYYIESDGRVYRRSLGFGLPMALTPSVGKAASPAVSPNEEWLIYVYTLDGQDGLAAVRTNGDRWPVQAARGADFYMQPTWSPDGEKVAWVEWDHPNMPWSGSRLMIGNFNNQSGVIEEPHQVAGGPEIPVLQPLFSPDGHWLSYLLGEEDGDAFCVYNLESEEPNVLLQEIGLLSPAWTQGVRVYDWNASSDVIYLLRNRSGTAGLCRLSLDGSPKVDLDTGPYTWLRQISVFPMNDSVACIASAPGIPDQVITWEDGKVQVRRRSLAELIDPADFSTPKPIEWLAKDGTTIYGLYFPPHNPAFSSEGLPPAVIHIHGGPTSQQVAGFDADAAFFTSRGFGYLSVNYRGSTGYGRIYERKLNAHWGDYDVEDAAGAAQALGDQGLADPKRIVIEGGSAGGYTVLNALIRFPGQFKAGISSYGVSDLFNLVRDTHKFEARYLDSLVGPLPESAALYHEWSPIHALDKIQDPMAIFHGTDDKVVPVGQSDLLAESLKAKGVPYIYYKFEGEGHGFRKSVNLETYYRELNRFLQEQVVLG